MEPQTAQAAERSASSRVSVEAAARYIGLSVAFLNKQRLKGTGPAYLKLGRRVAYEVSDLDNWLNACRRQPASEARAA